jgi:hypothetical protein
MECRPEKIAGCEKKDVLDGKGIVDCACKLPLVIIHKPKEGVNDVSVVGGLEAAAGAEKFE